jgi:hypothetical protein
MIAAGMTFWELLLRERSFDDIEEVLRAGHKFEQDRKNNKTGPGAVPDPAGLTDSARASELLRIAA